MHPAFGGVSILSNPATPVVDSFVVGPSLPRTDPLPSTPMPNCPRLWTVLLGWFMAAAFLAGIAAVLYGVSAA